MQDALRDFPLKPIPWALALSIAACAGSCSSITRAPSTNQAVFKLLQEQGLECSDSDILVIDPPSSFRDARVIARAWREGEPADIYLLRVRALPNGTIIGHADTYNLTGTSAADEGTPMASGTRIFFDVRESGQTLGIRRLDLNGEAPLDGDWSRLARLQNSLSNLQQTGQTKGVDSTFWAVDPPTKASLNLLADGTLEVNLPAAQAKLLADRDDAIGPPNALQLRPAPKARPGNLITWAVDRVRQFEWFGDDRMQIIKAVAFGFFDNVKRAQASILGDHTEEDIAQNLGAVATRNTPAAFTDPETGWPPAPMELFMKKPLPGEGQWIPLDNDPFMASNPGAPPAFVTSFIRTDRERLYTHIYVTLWDPRQVELHPMAGTIEPRGASGEAGPGLVPRTPEKMKRLVAAMNGGFQAMHGEWGMMGDGVIYLPPKPFAATIAELRDGSTAFGTWPDDPQVPADVVGYRQNLTVLVLDGQINPYKRGWWGGTPPDWEDRVHSTRTGICLTKENFVAYFWGNEIDYMPLAQAMVQARCKFGMHLDMNPGHTGLEFYNVAPTDQLAPLGRPLDKMWEAEDKVDHMDGWSFRARRMVRHMGLMNFPRYIQREARDFFYLTLRPVLPGADLKPTIDPAETDEGKWKVKGLPQHGFPFAIATTTLRSDNARPATKLAITKLDPRTLRAGQAVASDAKAQPVVAISGAPPSPSKPTVWLSHGAFSIANTSPSPDSTAILSGIESSAPDAANASAAVCVQDEEGMLVYAEIQGEHRPGADGPLLVAALKNLGCSSIIALKTPLSLTMGSAAPNGSAVTLYRGESPGAKRFFEDTPIVGPKEWGPLQARRIRYFKHNKAGKGSDATGGKGSESSGGADSPE